MDISDKIFLSLVGLMFTTLIILFILLVHAELTRNFQIELENEYKIVSLRNRNNISGSFILGSGYISEKEYYYTFKKVSNNSYKRLKIPTDNTTIIETNKKEPKLVKYQRSAVFGLVDKGEFYKLYVPKGTIIKKFKVK